MFAAGGERAGESSEGRGSHTDDGSAGERTAVHHLLGALHRGTVIMGYCTLKCECYVHA